MRSILLLSVVLSVLYGRSVEADNASAKVVCFYDGRSFNREGIGRATVDDIEAAVPFCTHLVFGYAGIAAGTNKIKALDEARDLETGKNLYRLVTNLKSKFPSLKVMLSVGGDADKESPEKYLTLLESSAARVSFVNSVYSLIKTYSFDGLDLAWQFPAIKPKKIHSTFGSAWKNFKKVFSGDSVVDEKSDEHRDEFTSLVQDLKNTFRHDSYLLSVTVLPNVNASLYYDVPAIINNLDFINVAAFDQQTPTRNPKEADFPAPLYNLNDRNPEFNVDFQVKYWTSNTAPASKINVGIPTFGRAWKMNSDSGITGVPPLTVKGPAAEGLQSHIPGFLNWAEICAKLPNPSNQNLKGEDAPCRRVGDPTKRFGPYAYRLPDAEGNFGMWIGYDDPDAAGNKAGYVKAKGLGGIALFDLSNDDFRGSCSGDKFPILRAAKYRL